jgi:hypothetical protein
MAKNTILMDTKFTKLILPELGIVFVVLSLLSTTAVILQKLAGKYANAAGALAASKLGPMEGNSTLGEIQHLLDSDKVQTRECI